IDHIQPVEDNGPVALSNLCRLCSWHHDKKTNAGYVVYKDGNGDWHFDPPPPFGQEPDLGGELYDLDGYGDDQPNGGTSDGQGDGNHGVTRSGAGPPGNNSKRGARSDRTPGPGRNAGPGRRTTSGRDAQSGRKAQSGDNAGRGKSPPLFDPDAGA
ncbi:MAG: hypothetical protein QOJ44_276, partial [Acidimicrobiaceae bacterium]|nr:hypothetical protein [Acidimicrobiaceae bacterium]